MELSRGMQSGLNARGRRGRQSFRDGLGVLIERKIPPAGQTLIRSCSTMKSRVLRAKQRRLSSERVHSRAALIYSRWFISARDPHYSPQGVSTFRSRPNSRPSNGEIRRQLDIYHRETSDSRREAISVSSTRSGFRPGRVNWLKAMK